MNQQAAVNLVRSGCGEEGEPLTDHWLTGRMALPPTEAGEVGALGGKVRSQVLGESSAGDIRRHWVYRPGAQDGLLLDNYV